jgi:hypothetical protein
MIRWLKIPGPGEFRGEGNWWKIEDLKDCSVEDWEWNVETGYLPTHEGDEPPKEEKPREEPL